jgi:hypothetical protein
LRACWLPSKRPLSARADRMTGQHLFGPAPRLSVDAQLELNVAFADEDSPVYDENVPGVLLERREHVGALVARYLTGENCE